MHTCCAIFVSADVTVQSQWGLFFVISAQHLFEIYYNATLTDTDDKRINSRQLHPFSYEPNRVSNHE